MISLSTILCTVLGITFAVFVAFFGRLPMLRHTPIGMLHRLLTIRIPNWIVALDQRLTGARALSSLTRFGNYMMYDKHPTVLIFFILLLVVSEVLYLPTAWPRLGRLHQVLGSVAIFCPYLFLYLSVATDPGTITPANHGYYMSLYPYDHTVYHPGRACRTCRLLKPARSKHCGVCRRCVGRMDHHCIFINNCVGYGNQHWFLLLLLSTAALCTYGGLLGLSLVRAAVRVAHPAFTLWKPRTMDLNRYLVLWSWGLQDSVGLGAVTLLALLVCPLVWGLLAYQLYLVYCGTTTNETIKWADWAAEMADGFAFRRPADAARPKDPRFEAPWTRWPVETEQVVVRTDDGRPPPADAALPGHGEWVRVWRLRDVENLYDLGLWDNLLDVFTDGDSFSTAREDPLSEKRGRTKRKRGLPGGTVLA